MLSKILSAPPPPKKKWQISFTRPLKTEFTLDVSSVHSYNYKPLI